MHVYRKLGLQMIPAELREGYDEIDRAADGGCRTLLPEPIFEANCTRTRLSE